MILVSFMGFVGVPDMMEHTRCVFDIPLLCKSKMAATSLYKIVENVPVLVEPNADGPHSSTKWVILTVIWDFPVSSSKHYAL